MLQCFKQWSQSKRFPPKFFRRQTGSHCPSTSRRSTGTAVGCDYQIRRGRVAMRMQCTVCSLQPVWRMGCTCSEFWLWSLWVLLDEFKGPFKEDIDECGAWDFELFWTNAGSTFWQLQLARWAGIRGSCASLKLWKSGASGAFCVGCHLDFGLWTCLNPLLYCNYTTFRWLKHRRATPPTSLAYVIFSSQSGHFDHGRTDIHTFDLCMYVSIACIHEKDSQVCIHEF